VNGSKACCECVDGTEALGCRSVFGGEIEMQIWQELLDSFWSVWIEPDWVALMDYFGREYTRLWGFVVGAPDGLCLLTSIAQDGTSHFVKSICGIFGYLLPLNRGGGPGAGNGVHANPPFGPFGPGKGTVLKSGIVVGMICQSVHGTPLCRAREVTSRR
jgi:hypothetical protein